MMRACALFLILMAILTVFILFAICCFIFYIYQMPTAIELFYAFVALMGLLARAFHHLEPIIDVLIDALSPYN